MFILVLLQINLILFTMFILKIDIVILIILCLLFGLIIDLYNKIIILEIFFVLDALF